VKALALALGAAAGLWVSACTPATQLPAANPVAVLLRDGQPVCSAFAVSDNHMLTAAHCVRDSDNVQVVPRQLWDATGSGAIDAKVAWRDLDRDLALLETAATFQATLRFRAPVTGEGGVAIAARFNWARSSGEVLPGAGFFRDTTIDIEHGWSGSPVIARDGKVIGVIARCEGRYVGLVHVCNPDNAQISVLP
jgi:S1-C subfamily serine protease